jgi:hypothetical protein
MGTYSIKLGWSNHQDLQTRIETRDPINSQPGTNEDLFGLSDNLS